MPPKKRAAKEQASGLLDKSAKTKQATEPVSLVTATDASHIHKESKTDRFGSKRVKRDPSTKSTGSGQQKNFRAPIINQAPAEVLAIFAFGNGESGELGLGPGVTEAVRPRLNPHLDPGDSAKHHIVQLDCGGMHTVALTDDNRIVTWGVNDKGALGRETAWEGGLRDIDEDASDTSGDLNPHESIPTHIPVECFPSGTVFTQVAAGDSCSFALTNTGLVYGWGTFRDSDGKDLFALDANGAVVEVQPKPALVPGLTNITQITCGANHALALDLSGNVWAWGAGEQNQLGRRLLGRRRLQCLKPTRVEVARKNVHFIASGEYHSFAIDKTGNVWAWGLNSFGEAGYADAAGGDSALLPHPMKVRDLCGKGVVSLDGGAHHSVAVTADGECLAWGRMDCGQLGIEFTPEQLADESLIRRDHHDKPRICLRPSALGNVGKVAEACCGTDHTLLIDKDGQAYAAGFGTQGQLGLGSYDDVPVAQPVEAKAIKERTLTWAGAGGQFSMVAAPAKLANGR